MTIFAFSLSIANIWRPLSALTGVGIYNGWSLWGYFSGFIFGGLIFWYYSRFPDKKLKETDLPLGLKYKQWKPVLTFLLFTFAFYRFILHGIGESLEGAIRKALAGFGIENSPSGDTLMIITTVLGTILYGHYFYGKIGERFRKRSFQEKSLITLIVLLPLHYLFYSTSTLQR